MATASSTSLGTHGSTPIPGLTDGHGYGRDFGFWNNVRCNYPHDLHEHLLRQQANPHTPHDEMVIPETLEELTVLQTEVGTWDPATLNVSGAINLLTRGLIRVWANIQRLSVVPETVKLDKLLETFEPACVVAFQIAQLSTPKEPKDKLVLREPKEPQVQPVPEETLFRSISPNESSENNESEGGITD
jgi:hypothetical protein